MNQKTTLKKLAKELNVSVSTVSKSLNDSSEISTKTIHRVKELAALYGYKPNPVAVSLKRNKTNTLGILIPDILNHFFAKVLYGIEQEASKRGYKIITCLTNESHSKEIEYLKMLEYNKVDGVIAALSKETQIKEDFQHFIDYKKNKNHLVLFDRVNEKIDCDKVLVDDFGAGERLIHYLKQKKRNNIVVISTIPNLSVSKARLSGVKQASKNCSITLHTLLINHEEDKEKLIRNFLQTYKVNAVIGLDELAAATAINMAKHLQISIPNQIAIVGFTDGLLAKNAYPKMTVISQHATKIGSKTVELLTDKISNKNKEVLTIILPTTLIKRGSSE